MNSKANQSARDWIQARYGAPVLDLGKEELFQKPLVYAWFRGDVLMYVGRSLSGMDRPLSRTHHAFNEFSQDDRLLIWRFENEDEASSCEADLVSELNPRINRSGCLSECTCQDCGSLFMANHRTRRCSECKKAFDRKRAIEIKSEELPTLPSNHPFLKLRTQTRKRLLRAGIDADRLAGLSELELLELRGLGWAAVREIRRLTGG